MSHLDSAGVLIGLAEAADGPMFAVVPRGAEKFLRRPDERELLAHGESGIAAAAKIDRKKLRAPYWEGADRKVH
jgi:hypothetical protein